MKESDIREGILAQMHTIEEKIKEACEAIRVNEKEIITYQGMFCLVESSLVIYRYPV